MYKSSFAAALTLAASFSLPHEARAAPPPPLSGYVTDLTISLATRDDSTSGIACQWMPANPRLPGVRYKKAQHFLSVQIATVPKGPVPEIGKPFADPTKGNVVVVLKDAAGATIDTQQPLGNTVSFAKLGAEVCVQAPEEETDAGAPDGGTKLLELCKPVTITSLEVTAAEQTAHDAAVATQCAMHTDAGTSSGSSSGASGTSGSTSGSSGTSGNTASGSSGASGVIASGSTSSGGSGMVSSSSSTGGPTTTEGGGCNISASNGAVPALGLFAIIGLALRGRRRSCVRR
jgi:hypothetical protein